MPQGTVLTDGGTLSSLQSSLCCPLHFVSHVVVVLGARRLGLKRNAVNPHLPQKCHAEG